MKTDKEILVEITYEIYSKEFDRLWEEAKDIYKKNH